MADQTVTFTRRAGVTSGPENFTVTISEDDGNATSVSDGEANQAITRARAAQSGVDLSNYDMSVGSTAVTRDRYTTLIGGGSAAVPPTGGDAAAARPTDLTIAPRASGLWAIGADFRYLIGLGGRTHSGPGGDILVTHQMSSFDRFRPRFTFGLTGQSVSMNYPLPGSSTNDANSTFNFFGAVLGIGARTPIADRNRLSLDYDILARLGYYWTPGNHMGTVMGGGGQICYDAGGGRQQCEERGSGSPTNLGDQGGYVPSVGNSAYQSGFGLDLALRLMLGYSIPVGSGAVNIAGGADLGYFTPTGNPYVAPGVRVMGEF